MENAKKIKTTTAAAALITVAVVIMCLASSTLAVNDGIPVQAKEAAPVETLLVGRAGNGCIPKGEPCGALHHCCPHLYCTSFIQGTCVCIGEGQPCGLQHVCCKGLSCTGAFTGTCIRVTGSTSTQVNGSTSALTEL